MKRLLAGAAVIAPAVMAVQPMPDIRRHHKIRSR
jgi:hypothetical protein